MHDGLEKIAVLDSLIQARRLEGALKNRDIPYVLRSYHDSALDGLFQASKGWGHVEASPEHRERILEILADLAPEETGEEPPRSAESS